MEKTSLNKIKKLKNQYLLNKNIRYALLKTQNGFQKMTLTQIQQALIRPSDTSKYKTIPIIRDVFNTAFYDGPVFNATQNHDMIARLYSQSKFK